MVLTMEDQLEKAAVAFDDVANRPNQILRQTIAVSDFPEVWCKLNKGLPYCEEQHMRTLNKISEYVKVIPRQAFLDSFPPWYQEEAGLEEKFNEIAEGSNHIATTDLPNLLENMSAVKVNSNTFFFEKTDNISEEVKVITRQAFLEWYGWYMFED